MSDLGIYKKRTFIITFLITTALIYLLTLLSCQDLRTPFMRSAFIKLEKNDPEKARDFSREFINLHFVIEIVRTILWLKRETLLSIQDDEMGPLSLLLSSLLRNESKVYKSDSNIDIVIEAIERRSADLSSLFDFNNYIPSNMCRDDLLVKIAEKLRLIPSIQNKNIWYLIDDYTIHLIPPFVQEAYNPIVFKISSEIRIKLSSEGDGPLLNDHLGREYKEGREFSKVNLGEKYFNTKEEIAQKFIEAILQARFKETGKGSIKELKIILGEHPHGANYGNYILKQSTPGRAKFHGFGLLCLLCSGDISFIIELFRQIVHLTGHKWGAESKKINPTKQHELTKQFANQQLLNLRETQIYGPKMYDFAMNMGNLIKEYLLKSPNKNDPDERLRIEIECNGKLSNEAISIHEALLRHSVLINGGFGKDRSGNPTKKFFFRKLFAPCFPFSPLRKGCIALPIKKYEKWLMNPNMIKKEEDKWDEGLGGINKENK